MHISRWGRGSESTTAEEGLGSVFTPWLCHNVVLGEYERARKFSYKMVMVEMVLTSKALTRDWGETELVNAETTT